MSFGIPVRNGLAIGLLASTFLSSLRVGGRPAMFLNFINTTSLDPRVTFTRGSNATLVDSTGKITYAPANLLLNSVFGGAVSGTPGTAPTSWSLGFNTGTLTVTSLGRSYTANTLRFATTSSREVISQTVTIAANSTYIISANVNVFTAAQLIQLFGFNPTPAGATVQYVYNGVNQASSFSPPTGTGMLQAIVTTAGTAGSLGVRVGVGASANVTGDVSFEDIQLEPVTYQTVPSTYNPTTTAAYYGPRFDYDPVTLAPKGLLIEEQRVNLLTFTQQFDNAVWGKANVTIAANVETSPDGTLNADKLVDTAINGEHYAEQSVTVVSGSSYTFSMYVKADGRDQISLRYTGGILWVGGSSPQIVFSLLTETITIVSGGAAITASSLIPVGGGWYRCSMTATVAMPGTAGSRIQLYKNGTAIYTGDGVSGAYLFGAQTETGSFATSYIPTVASQVTRSADVATMTGTNFSSWYNASEGSFVSQFTTSTISGARTVLDANDNTANESIRLRTMTADPFFTVTDGGVNQADIDAGTVAASTTYKMAGAYKVNDFATSIGGGTVGTDVSGTIPTVNQLQIGNSAAGNRLNGHIRTIAYYNTRLPDAQLQALTT